MNLLEIPKNIGNVINNIFPNAKDINVKVVGGFNQIGDYNSVNTGTNSEAKGEGKNEGMPYPIFMNMRPLFLLITSIDQKPSTKEFIINYWKSIVIHFVRDGRKIRKSQESMNGRMSLEQKNRLKLLYLDKYPLRYCEKAKDEINHEEALVPNPEWLKSLKRNVNQDS